MLLFYFKFWFPLQNQVINLLRVASGLNPCWSLISAFFPWWLSSQVFYYYCFIAQEANYYYMNLIFRLKHFLLISYVRHLFLQQTSLVGIVAVFELFVYWASVFSIYLWWRTWLWWGRVFACFHHHSSPWTAASSDETSRHAHCAMPPPFHDTHRY